MVPRRGSNPKAASTTRYGRLGGKQRSAETPTGNILMGVRLYDPVSGRFLSTDPVLGGNANAYEYCSGDPINCVDLDGRIGIVNRFKNKVKKWVAKQTARATSWAVNKFATTIGRYKCHYRYGMRVCTEDGCPCTPAAEQRSATLSTRARRTVTSPRS